MTYRKSLKDNLDPIEDLGGMTSIVFSNFLISMAMLINLDAATMIAESEDEILDVSLGMIQGILNHDDLLNSISVHFQIKGFLDWLLDQELPEDGMSKEHDDMWYGIAPLVDKWNEYAKTMNQGELE